MRLGPFSVLLSARTIAVVLLLLAVGAGVGVLALGSGDLPLSPGRVIQALLGTPEQPLDRIAVVEWRLPRVAGALLIGAALGLAGCIFQSLTRNPLGSPDIIGFDSGATTGALLVIVFLGGGAIPIVAGAVIGGFVAAAVVAGLAYRRGSAGLRLILTGIAVGAMLLSINQWLVTVADPRAAMTANVWTVGTLADTGWDKVRIVAVTLLVLGVAMVFLARPMQTLELGDDSARARGVRPGVVRGQLLVAGVLLTATAVAAAGPISFVALCAPQLARRLTGSAGVTPGASTAMGAVLLLLCDTLSTRVLGGLPVGAVTVCVGGAYFVWLLIREARRS